MRISDLSSDVCSSDLLEKYQARETLDGSCKDLDALTQQARQGMILREGLHVVLAGQPNVGKSSLLNALAGDDIAIVTPIAGPPRDEFIQQIHIQGDRESVGEGTSVAVRVTISG